MDSHLENRAQDEKIIMSGHYYLGVLMYVSSYFQVPSLIYFGVCIHIQIANILLCFWQHWQGLLEGNKPSEVQLDNKQTKTAVKI